MSCTTCPPAANCQTDLLCTPPVFDPNCCCLPKGSLAAPHCPVEVCEILSCETDNRSAFFVPNSPDGRGLACACVCLDENLALNATQKAAIVKMLDGVMRAIVPANYDYCCDTQEFRNKSSGHTFPLQPISARHQQIAGVWTPVGGAGQPAINPALPIQYFPVGDNCCGTGNKESPFTRGSKITYDVGMGRPNFFTDRDAMGGSSAAGWAKLADIFCCAKDMIANAA